MEMSAAPRGTGRNAKARLSLRIAEIARGHVDFFIEDATASFLDLFGFTSAAEIVNRHPLEVLPQEDYSVSEWIETYLLAPANPEPILLPQYFWGLARWLVTEVSLDASGRIELFFRKPLPNKTEQSLVFLKQKMLVSDLSAPVGSWLIDYEKKFVLFSKELATLFRLGTTATCMTLREFKALIAPEHRIKVLSILGNTTHFNKGVEHLGIRADGSKVWLYSFAIAYHDEDGNITRIFGKTQNIHQRKTHEENLLASERKYRGIIENSSDLFFVMDHTQNLVYISPNVPDVLGYRPEELIGNPKWMAILQGEKEGDLSPLYLRMLETREGFRRKYVLFHKSGREVHLLSNFNPTYDENGNLLEVIVISKDVTAEERTARLNEYYSTHDVLTGLRNRLYFETEIARIEAEDIRNLCVVVGDINGLKFTNDTFGHNAGDEQIRAIVKIVRSELREKDLFMRTGGDEFVVFLYDTKLAEARAICARINELCDHAPPLAVPYGISLGVAKLSGRVTLKTAIIAAEEEMYRRKKVQNEALHARIVRYLEASLDGHYPQRRLYLRTTTALIGKIASRMGLAERDVKLLKLMTRYHDIGVAALSDAPPDLQGSLTKEAYAYIKQHCDVGFRMCKTLSPLQEICEYIYQHHERWDGGGYPYGKKKKEIPFLTRIFSVIDAYGVMTSGQTYKKSISRAQATKELEKNAGSQFDPEIVKEVTACLRRSVS